MAKLDRLGWAAGRSVRCHGVRVGLRVSEGGALPSLVSRLPPGTVAARGAEVDVLFSLVVGGAGARPGLRRLSLVYADARLVSRAADEGDALDAFESEVRLFVAEHAPRHVFVHAGVVGWRGRAIVIPGASHSGKSRLVQALVAAGATYYSDEYAVVDERGRVHAFPSALSIRGAPGERPRRIDAGELGGGPHLPPLRAGLVAACPFLPGRRPRLRRASPGEGVLELMSHAVPARRRPAEVLATLARMARGAGVLRGTRGEAEEAARRLLEGEAVLRAARA